MAPLPTVIISWVGLLQAKEHSLKEYLDTTFWPFAVMMYILNDMQHDFIRLFELLLVKAVISQ